MLHLTRSLFRPAPDPMAGWVWAQRWLDVLFLHWQVPANTVREVLPAGLEPDTRDGSAWVSLVAFRLEVRPRGLPFVPGLSAMPEVNVRTYARGPAGPGVFFLSIHAGHRLAAGLARRLTPLPYRHAHLATARTADGLRFDAANDPHRLALDFRPTTRPAALPAGSRSEWLLDRYRAYAWSPRAGLVTAEVEHAPWDASPAAVTGETRWGHVPDRPADAADFSPGVSARFGRWRPAGRE